MPERPAARRHGLPPLGVKQRRVNAAIVYPFQGTRVEHIADLWPHEEHGGFYCPVVIDGKRSFYCVTPNGHAGNLAAHDVTEHEDGTITVSPSILVSNPQQGELFHGYLEGGVWRAC